MQDFKEIIQKFSGKEKKRLWLGCINSLIDLEILYELYKLDTSLRVHHKQLVIEKSFAEPMVHLDRRERPLLLVLLVLVEPTLL